MNKLLTILILLFLTIFSCQIKKKDDLKKAETVEQSETIEKEQKSDKNKNSTQQQTQQVSDTNFERTKK